jgi:signal transduction histidine kinase
MSELVPADYRDAPRHGTRPVPAAGSQRAAPGPVTVVLGTSAAVRAVGVVAYLLAGDHSLSGTRLALTAAAALVVVLATAAAAAGSAARAADRRAQGRLMALRAASAGGQADLRVLAEKVRHGERLALSDPGPAPAADGDPVTLLAHDLQRERHAAQLALVRATAAGEAGTGSRADSRVEVFVNMARRMQSILHREIQALDQIESQVEEPDLLKGLFTIDHFATRMRRYTESLAVLGGAVSRRHWSRPVPVHEVLRAAIAEVEHYARVKIVPPVPGTLEPRAVADVIHLIAELIDNATKFSPPSARVLLRAGEVAAGLAIDVEDRGLGMDPAEQQKMNGVLADSGGFEISELLSDGRIGLFVVSALARRHGIVVQLQRNIFGGTQAVVVLPPGLVGAGSQLRGASLAQSPAGPAAPRESAPAEPGGAGGQAVPHQLPVRVPAGTHPAAIPNGAGHRPAAGSPPAPPRAADAPVPPQEGGSERPSLPRRGTGSHLAPQLRNGPGAAPDEPAAGHTPGLMAAFQGGFKRSEEEEETDNPDRG